MSIPTRQCIVGEIASQPEWSKTPAGTVRFYARVKIRARRQQADGTWGRSEDSFHNLVAYGRAAERGRSRLREGDFIVAAGYVRTYSYEQDGRTRTGEEFIVRWWGHESWRTEYTVARSGLGVRLPFRPRQPKPSPLARFVGQSPVTAPVPAA